MHRLGKIVLVTALSALGILALFCGGVYWSLLVVPMGSGWLRALLAGVGVLLWLSLALSPGAILVVHHLALIRDGECWPLPWISSALALLGGLVLLGTVGLRVYLAVGGMWV
jgi:hypothetical protein